MQLIDYYAYVLKISFMPTCITIVCVHLQLAEQVIKLYGGELKKKYLYLFF